MLKDKKKKVKVKPPKKRRVKKILVKKNPVSNEQVAEEMSKLAQALFVGLRAFLIELAKPDVPALSAPEEKKEINITDRSTVVSNVPNE